MWPRFFLPAGDPRPLPALPAEQLCDLFLLGDAAEESAVVRDALGVLRVVAMRELPGVLVREVHARELASGLPRRLRVRELWLLELHGVEASGHTQGVNDPVECVGRLTGPFGGGASPSMQAGRLSVTRADLLAAHVADAAAALPVLDGSRVRSAWIHALLPGDRAEAVAAGEGVVLAYRLHPVELGSEPGNEQPVTELLFDTLRQLRDDLAAENVRNPLREGVLPVLDREAAIAELRKEGFTVEGDFALPNAGFSDRVVTTLTTLLGPNSELDKLRRPVPPQGTLAAYLALAKQSLAALPAWPDARAVALRRLVEPPGAAPPAGAPGALQAIRAGRVAPATPAPPPIVQALPARPEAWEADFTSPARPARPPKAKKRPAWMDDFEP